jgi:hypothetical protein
LVAAPSTKITLLGRPRVRCVGLTAAGREQRRHQSDASFGNQGFESLQKIGSGFLDTPPGRVGPFEGLFSDLGAPCKPQLLGPRVLPLLFHAIGPGRKDGNGSHLRNRCNPGREHSIVMFFRVPPSAVLHAIRVLPWRLELVQPLHHFQFINNRRPESGRRVRHRSSPPPGGQLEGVLHGDE